MEVYAVEDNGHVGKFLFAIHFPDVRQRPYIETAGPDDEHRQVGYPVHEGSIGDHPDRDSVHDYVIVSGPEFCEQGIEPCVHQEFGRVRDRRAGHEHIRHIGVRADAKDIVRLEFRFGQIVGHPDMGLFGESHLGTAPEIPGKGLLSDIQIYSQHLLARVGKAYGQVHGYERLSGSFGQGRQGDDLPAGGVPHHE